MTERLKAYLERRNLYVLRVGDKFEVADADGKTISVGASASTAVLKAIWLDADICMCKRGY